MVQCQASQEQKEVTQEPHQVDQVSPQAYASPPQVRQDPPQVQEPPKDPPQVQQVRPQTYRELPQVHQMTPHPHPPSQVVRHHYDDDTVSAQAVRQGLLDVINTRNADLTFPIFNQDTDLFYIWKTTVLRICMTHHQLSKWILVAENGTLSVDPSMDQQSQSLFLTALQKSIPNKLWATYCPIQWELQNKAIDIWEELDRELGLVVHSRAQREEILHEWQHFKARKDEDLDDFRRRFMLLHDKACANGLHQDQYREALKFVLLFACSRSNNELQHKLLSKYEKMMNEDLTSWWVNGYDSAFRGIRDFMTTQKTLKNRVDLYVDKVTPSSASNSTSTASGNKNKNDSNSRKTDKENRDKQGRDD